MAEKPRQLLSLGFDLEDPLLLCLVVLKAPVQTLYDLASKFDHLGQYLIHHFWNFGYKAAVENQYFSTVSGFSLKQAKNDEKNNNKLSD